MLMHAIYFHLFCTEYRIATILDFDFFTNIRSTCRYLSTIFYFHLCSQFFKRIVSWRENSLWFLKDKEIIIVQTKRFCCSIKVSKSLTLWLCMLVFAFLLCKWIETGAVCDKTLLSNKIYKYIKRKKFRAECLLKVRVRTS